MFEVNGNIITTEPIEILIELKNQLAVNGVYLFKDIKQSGINIQFSCPIHKQGQERKPSCGVNTVKYKKGKREIPAGSVHCFQCGYIAPFEEMVSNCFGKDDGGDFGKQWLIKNFLMIKVEERKSIELNLQRVGNETQRHPCKYLTDDEIDKYRFCHPYMFERKLTEEIINKFDVGYDKETDSITFPVLDENQNILFVARRSVKGKFFHYPENAQKPVYGLLELAESGLSPDAEIIICESIINALTCWVYGKPAVALMGLGTEYQYKQLRNLPYRKFIIGLDPDDAGERAALKLKKNLSNKIITKYILPENKDINDLTYEEFINLEEIFS